MCQMLVEVCPLHDKGQQYQRSIHATNHESSGSGIENGHVYISGRKPDG